MARRRTEKVGSDRRFPYAERAAAARQAKAAVGSAFAAMTDRRDESDPNTIAWNRAVDAFWAAVQAAYPPGYRAAFDSLRRGKGRGTDLLIDFLDADPIFFRSGYEKEEIIRCLKRAPLEPDQAERLRGVIIRIVRERDAREFRHYCRLAHRVDAPGLRSDLAALAADPDKDRRRRAGWMIASLENAERTKRGLAKARRNATP